MVGPHGVLDQASTASLERLSRHQSGLADVRRYGARTIPAGAHNREFMLLNEDEQAQAVRRLRLSGYDEESICSVTGLAPIEVHAILSDDD